MEYKEKLRLAKEALDSGSYDKKTIEYIFPEFKESREDEMIRVIKEVILNSVPYKENILTKDTTITAEEAIAWLEKRGEQKPYGLREECKDCQCNYAGECKGSCAMKRNEQNPIKVPKFKVGDFIQFNGMGHTRYTIKEVCGLSHYINTCNKRMDMSYTDANFELVEQKPWSEEDEYCRHQLIVFCENCMVPDSGAIKCAHWLKSLKGRVQPQSTWKPSDEQMRTLEYYMHTLISNKHKEVLFGLMEQLKKLREE